MKHDTERNPEAKLGSAEKEDVFQENGRGGNCDSCQINATP